MKLVRPLVVDRQLKVLLVLLKCENKGSNVSDAKVNGEGCLLKQSGVGNLAMSKSWLMREVSHLVEDIL
jgi:hypothetical protein